MSEWLEQPGLVLLVEHYDACVEFYRDILGLEVYSDLGDLIVFRFGAAYLAVEQGGVARKSVKSPAESAVNLRLNVANVEAQADRLRAKGGEGEVGTFGWGTIGKFTDPDGNRCEFRSHFDGFLAPKR